MALILIIFALDTSLCHICVIWPGGHNIHFLVIKPTILPSFRLINVNWYWKLHLKHKSKRLVGNGNWSLLGMSCVCKSFWSLYFFILIFFTGGTLPCVLTTALRSQCSTEEIHVSWKWKICPYFIHNAQTKIHSISQWWNLCIKGDDCTSWSTHSIVSLQCAHDSSCHEMHQFEIDLDHCLGFFIYIGQTLQLISIFKHPNKWIRIRIDTCFKTPKIGNFPV